MIMQAVYANQSRPCIVRRSRVSLGPRAEERGQGERESRGEWTVAVTGGECVN